MENKVTLIIAALNEINGMKEIMPRIKIEWVDEIIIVDGGSTDGTFEYAKENGYFIIKQKVQGLTSAYHEALEIATGEIIITFSPDGNSIPELIPLLVKKIKEGYDMVIVSRYIYGAKSYDDDIITAFGNYMFTKMINILFGGHYTDSLVMFRAWRKDLLKTLELDIKNIGVAGLEPLLAIRCAKQKLKVAEVPGDEPMRIGGERKMHPLINGTAIILLVIKELFYSALKFKDFNDNK